MVFLLLLFLLPLLGAAIPRSPPSNPPPSPSAFAFLSVITIALPCRSPSNDSVTFPYCASPDSTTLHFHRRTPLTSTSPSSPTYTLTLPHTSANLTSTLVTLSLFPPEAPQSWVITEQTATSETWLYAQLTSLSAPPHPSAAEWLPMSASTPPISHTTVHHNNVTTQTDLPAYVIADLLSRNHIYPPSSIAPLSSPYNLAVHAFRRGDYDAASNLLARQPIPANAFVVQHLNDMLTILVSAPSPPPSSNPPLSPLLYAKFPHCIDGLSLCTMVTSVLTSKHYNPRVLLQILNDVGATEYALRMYDELIGRGEEEECDEFGRIVNGPLVFETENAIAETRGWMREELLKLTESPAGQVARVNNPSCLPSLTTQLCYHGVPDLAMTRVVADTVLELTQIQTAANGPPNDPPTPPNPTRVVVVSSHIRGGSVCKAMCATIRALASPAIHVTVAYPSDMVVDGVSESVFKAVNSTIKLSTNLQSQVDTLSSPDYVFDVVIYTDVGYSPATMLLPYHRIAGTQIALWGHHGSSALDSIDYYVVADGFDVSSSQYSEQVIRMSASLGVVLEEDAYEWEDVAVGSLNWIATHHNAYIIPQSLPKFHPRFDDALERILVADSNNVVVVTSDGAMTIHMSVLRRRWVDKMGLSVASRIVFVDAVSRPTLLKLMASGVFKAALDTFPVGGGITSIEMAMCGISLVTWPGAQSVIKTSKAVLEEVGGECGQACCVAGSLDEYVEMAVKAANNINGDGEPCKADGGKLFEEGARAAVVSEWRQMITRLAAA